MNNFANDYFHLTKCSAAAVFCFYVFFLFSASICVAQNQKQMSTSDLFNTFIDGLTLFGRESLVPNSSADHPQQIKEQLQRLQQWISNTAAEVVVTYDHFEGKYLCQPRANDRSDGTDLFSAVSSHFEMSDWQLKTLGKVFKAVEKSSEQKFQFLQLLFSFGAILGAQMGATAKCEGGNCIGQLLKAFECAGGNWKHLENSIPNFGILTVMERMHEKLMERILLKAHSEETEEHRQQNIRKLLLLKDLNIGMSGITAFQVVLFFAEKASNPLSDKFFANFENYCPQSDWMILARNLMQKVLTAQRSMYYFEKFNADHYTMLAETELSEYEQIIADDFGDGTAAGENAGKGNVYAHYDDAIQIDWSPLRVVIEQMDKINWKLREIDQQKSKEKQLTEYLESAEFKFALQMSEKFTELLPMVKRFKEKTMKVDEFMKELANIQQNLEEELQRNEHLFNLITVIARNFGGVFVKIGDIHQIEICFDGAHKMLQKLYDLAIERLVKKKKGANGNDKQFECRGNDRNSFKAAIRELTGGNTAQSAKLLQYMDKFVPKREAPSHLINSFFTFATRLEAFLYGKSSGDANGEGEADRQAEEAKATKMAQPRHRIGAFIAATQCLGISATQMEESIFDSPIKVAKINSIEEKRAPLFGIIIEKPRAETEKQWIKAACKNNFKMLKQLEEHKFSIYDAIKLIRKIDQQIELHHIKIEIPAEVIALVEQFGSEQKYLIGWHNYSKNVYKKIQKCQNARLLQKILARFIEKLRKIGIDPKAQMVSTDLSIGETIQQTIKFYCEAYKGSDIEEEVEISLLQSVGYDLVMNFEFDPWRETRDRAADLLRNWTNFFLIYLNTEEEEEKMYETGLFLAANNELFDIILKLDNGKAVAKPINLSEMENIANEGFEVITDLQYLAHTGETRIRKGQRQKSAKGKDILEKEVEWHKERVAHFVEKEMPETMEQMIHFYGTKLHKDYEKQAAKSDQRKGN